MKAASAPRRQRKIQKQVARAEARHPKLEPRKAMQAGARTYPAPPFPRQHQSKPGRRLHSIRRPSTTHLFTSVRENWRTRSR